MPEQIDVSALKARIAGRRVIASVSGGKDSGAMSLWLHELGIEHDRVFMDTGWEHPDTYEYLRGPLTAALGPITEIRGDLTMIGLVTKKGMFPSRQRRFCTEELKVFPMQRYIAARVAEGLDVLNAVGIRRAESRARSAMSEWDWSEGFDCEVWRPLIAWSEQEVIDIHHRHGLRPNPLYLRGATRVGCFPCIMANKAELRLIADTAPEYIDKVRELEAVVGVSARERYERDRAAWLANPDPEPIEADFAAESAANIARAEASTDGEADEGHPEDGGYRKSREAWRKKKRRLESPFVGPSWFLAARGGAGMMPIDDAVAWSRTSRGGSVDQVELFAAGDSDAGCMRWGLCDTGGGEKGGA